MAHFSRSSGVLLPIFSLPSPYGIGTLGNAADTFIDFLHDSGVAWWQVLPVGPTGFGNSPYQSDSTYAGNPDFIDLDRLAEDGLLDREDLMGLDWGAAEHTVDYDRIHALRRPLLEKAAAAAWQRDRDILEDFQSRTPWLTDYARFMALKQHFAGASWTEWPEEFRNRQPAALERFSREHLTEMQFHVFLQYTFFRQWARMRDYARRKGVGLIGDLPIYVAMDSADVWSDPGSFQLDENLRPTAVAGVPPDYFSEDGQLWGNPLYRWDAMQQDGYGWWIRRIAGVETLFDVVRIDHFRGLESYWSVPIGETTAKNGHWCKGPDLDLVRVLTGWFPNLQFIAEDLGFLTPEVHQLLRDSGLPGMRVLEFAFDDSDNNPYLPHNYVPNCVCYAGTHDNNTLLGWLDDAKPEELKKARAYWGVSSTDALPEAMLRGGMRSVADLFVFQMQDLLGLDGKSRMNTPGTVGSNWNWRLSPGGLTEELSAQLAAWNRLYGRFAPEV